jgi:small redox-active disulfide protein 2
MDRSAREAARLTAPPRLAILPQTDATRVRHHMQEQQRMELKVLGTGCAKCRKLYEETEKAIAASGIPATLTKVEQIDQIIAHGVMMTPALLIDGQVKASGRLAYAADIVQWMMTAAAKAEAACGDDRA